MKMNVTAQLIDLMKFTAARQKVLSNNAANVDVPKFVAKELDQNERKRRISMTATANGHFTQAVAGKFSEVRDAEAQNFKPSGNNVDATEQALKMGETQRTHMLATSLYHKIHTLIRAAATGK